METIKKDEKMRKKNKENVEGLKAWRTWRLVEKKPEVDSRKNWNRTFIKDFKRILDKAIFRQKKQEKLPCTNKSRTKENSNGTKIHSR